MFENMFKIKINKCNFKKCFSFFIIANGLEGKSVIRMELKKDKID